MAWVKMVGLTWPCLKNTFFVKTMVSSFYLVPHTTHEMQPLGTAVFGTFKSKWQEACHQSILKNPGGIITKYTFNVIFSEAWLNIIVPANKVSDLKTCGVYPFNPKAVLDHDPCEPSHSGSDLQSSGPGTSIGDSSYTHNEFAAEEESHFARGRILCTRS